MIRGYDPKDENAVVVLFRADRCGKNPEVCAVFPLEAWDNRSNFTCYAHVGQHGSCSREWVRGTRPATQAEEARQAGLRG